MESTPTHRESLPEMPRGDGTVLAQHREENHIENGRRDGSMETPFPGGNRITEGFMCRLTQHAAQQKTKTQ